MSIAQDTKCRRTIRRVTRPVRHLKLPDHEPLSDATNSVNNTRPGDKPRRIQRRRIPLGDLPFRPNESDDDDGSDMDDECVENGSAVGGEALFKCAQCEKAYIYRRGLKRHIKVTHGDGYGLECSLCLAPFTQKFSLVRHFKSQRHLKMMWNCISKNKPNLKKSTFMMQNKFDRQALLSLWIKTFKSDPEEFENQSSGLCGDEDELKTSVPEEVPRKRKSMPGSLGDKASKMQKLPSLMLDYDVKLGDELELSESQSSPSCPTCHLTFSDSAQLLIHIDEHVCVDRTNGDGRGSELHENLIRRLSQEQQKSTNSLTSSYQPQSVIVSSSMLPAPLQMSSFPSAAAQTSNSVVNVAVVQNEGQRLGHQQAMATAVPLVSQSSFPVGANFSVAPPSFNSTSAVSQIDPSKLQPSVLPLPAPIIPLDSSFTTSISTVSQNFCNLKIQPQPPRHVHSHSTQSQLPQPLPPLQPLQPLQPLHPLQPLQPLQPQPLQPLQLQLQQTQHPQQPLQMQLQQTQHLQQTQQLQQHQHRPQYFIPIVNGTALNSHLPTSNGSFGSHMGFTDSTQLPIGQPKMVIPPVAVQLPVQPLQLPLPSPIHQPLHPQVHPLIRTPVQPLQTPIQTAPMQYSSYQSPLETSPLASIPLFTTSSLPSHTSTTNRTTTTMSQHPVLPSDSPNSCGYQYIQDQPPPREEVEFQNVCGRIHPTWTINNFQTNVVINNRDVSQLTINPEHDIGDGMNVDQTGSQNSSFESLRSELLAPSLRHKTQSRMKRRLKHHHRQSPASSSSSSSDGTLGHRRTLRSHYKKVKEVIDLARSDKDEIETPATARPAKNGQTRNGAPFHSLLLAMDNTGKNVASEQKANSEHKSPTSVDEVVDALLENTQASEKSNPNPTGLPNLQQLSEAAYNAFQKKKDCERKKQETEEKKKRIAMIREADKDSKRVNSFYRRKKLK